jgi:putative copper export protein
VGDKFNPMKTPNPWLVILNDFFHDLFTGLWFGSFVTLAMLHSRATGGGLTPDQLTLMMELVGFFKWFCLASLGLIVATGIFRFFYYRNWDGIPMKDVKKKLLIIKHAVLGTSFLAGTVMVFVWA